MKKLVIILAAFGCLAGTASAATWTVTEVQAEAWARAHVVYVDQDRIAEETQQLADMKAARDYDCSKPAPNNCASSRQQYNTELQGWVASGRGRYHPTRVDCRGASPSRDAYHFSRFRCRAQFEVGWGNILITITGRNRAVWRWLP